MISSRNGRRKTHHHGRLLDARRLERGEASQVPLAAEATDVVANQPLFAVLFDRLGLRSQYGFPVLRTS